MSDRSNIAIFSYAYHPHIGGAEVAVQEITDRIPGKRFVCFTNHFRKDTSIREIVRNVEVVRIGGGTPYRASYFDKLRYIFLAWRAAEAEHKKRPFSGLWIIMASYGAAGALLFKLRHPRTPILLTLQEGDSEAHILRKVGVLYPVWKLLFKVSREVQTISVSLASLAKRHGARGRVSVVPNGVTLERYKKGHKKNTDNTTIITTSRLVAKNGIDILIRAFAILQKKNPDEQYVLRIVGDGPEREALERLARELNISSIMFLGELPPEQIPHELSQATLFVRPSRSEGLGNSFLEAMAAGVPIIGTDIGGIKDFLTDKETGMVVKPEDPEDLAEKMSILFSDRNLRARIAERAHALIKSRYSWETIAKEMDAILESTFSPALIVATGIFPPAIGGPATYAEFLLNFENEIGISPVRVVTYGDDNTQKTNRIQVVLTRLPKGIKHISFVWKLISEIWFFGNTLLYAVDSSLAAAGMAWIAAVFTRAQFIVRVTGDYAWEQSVQRFGVSDGIDEFQRRRYGFFVETFRLFCRVVVRRAAHVVVPSAYLKHLTIGWGVDPKRITVISNPVIIYERVRTKEEAKERLGISGRLIVSSGRFVPWKGFGEVIRAFPEIRSKVHDAVLVLIGDGPERGRLEAEAKASKVSEAIRFTGSLPKVDLAEWLSAADVFVLNSSYEGLSHQLIEAVAGFGLVAVASDAGGNKEVKEEFLDRITLVSPGVTSELISAIVSKLVSAKNVSVKRGSHKFSPEAVAASLHNFFSIK